MSDPNDSTQSQYSLNGSPMPPLGPSSSLTPPTPPEPVQPAAPVPPAQQNPYEQQVNPYGQQPAYGQQQPGYGQPYAQQQPAYGQPYASYQTPYAAGPGTNTLAIVALILGFVVPLGGIICGHIALGQIKRTGEGGRGLALAGTILGYSFTALYLLLIVVSIVLPLIIVGVAGSTYSGSFDS